MPDRFFRFAPAIFLLLWSTGYGVASIALRSAGVGTVLALRYGCVVLVLGVVLAVLRPAWPRGRAWLHLAVVGLLVQFGYFALNWTSLRMGLGVAVSALVGAGQPIVAAIVAPLSGGARPDRRLWAGLALGVAGAALVITARAEVQAPALVPLLLGVVSSFCLTAGSIYEKRFNGGIHPLVAAFVQGAMAMAAACVLALLTEDGHVDWSVPFVVSVAYLAFANSLVAITLLLAMMARGEVARVSALFFLVPPLAAAEAVVLTGERLPAVAWLGMAVAAGGVALATRTRRGPRAGNQGGGEGTA